MNAFIEKHSHKIIQLSDCGCMIWMGAIDGGGYGISYSGKKSPAGHNIPEGAHRLAYRAEIGTIKARAHILHWCDVPQCVNPDHLFIGNQASNMADMAAKKRSCIGSRHGRSTMSEATAIKLRAEYIFRKVTYRDLAEKYCLNPSAVAAVVRGASFKYLKEGKAP